MIFNLPSPSPSPKVNRDGSPEELELLDAGDVDGAADLRRVR